MSWMVRYKGQAKKALKVGNRSISQDARDAMNTLHLDLEEEGPTQIAWPNYSKLKKQGKNIDRRHCHLLKGKPTYVVCWEVVDKEKQILEVYYVGTHEKAPY